MNPISIRFVKEAKCKSTDPIFGDKRGQYQFFEDNRNIQNQMALFGKIMGEMECEQIEVTSKRQVEETDNDNHSVWVWHINYKANSKIYRCLDILSFDAFVCINDKKELVLISKGDNKIFVQE